MAFAQRLSALDASFLDVEEPTSHMHVGAVLLLHAAPLTGGEGGLDFGRIARLVDARLHDFPRYRQKLATIPVEGHPVWVDDADFHLPYHLRHTALPRPGSVRQLKRLAGRIMSQKLDRGKPLWELWVVEGVEGGHFAVIAKVHHCMIDGVSGMDLLGALLRPQPERDVAQSPAWRPRPAPSGVALVARELHRRALAPVGLLGRTLHAARDPRGASETLRNGASAVVELLGAGLRSASETPLNPERIGPHRRFDWIRFDLDTVHRLGHALGGTVNDVVLATVAGAAGEFLRRRGVRDPRRLDFRAMVPVSVRAERERGRLGNRVAQLVVPLPVGEKEPLRRLRRVVKTMERVKQSGQVRGAELIEALGDWTHVALVTQSQLLQSRVRSYNVVVTNVPGPPVPLFLLEAALLEIYPVVPLYRNQALGVALVGYRGGLYWGLNADWDRVPDLHDFVELLASGLVDLEKSISA